MRGPNPDNDHVEVYRDAAGEYRWRRVDDQNGQVVAVSGEGYVDEHYCRAAASAYNRGGGYGLDVRVIR